MHNNVLMQFEMVGTDYLKLQNQGNIISNIRLLYEMENSSGYADSQGYFSKQNVAEIGINSLLITSGSKVGDAALDIINSTDIDESLNSPLQNAKARMQILRVLGLVSSDYDSETYAITRLGHLIISQIISDTPNFKLLRELFLGITTATEIYEHNCAITFNCYLGYGICYALANLDYKLSSDEMPMLTTYDIKDINDFISEAQQNRSSHIRFSTAHPHFPKTQKGYPIKQVSNLTRSINQILRVCGIIKKKIERNGSVNYYVCTDEGRAFVDVIKQKFPSLKFITAIEFRKLNNIIEQKKICNSTYNAMLYRSGVDTSQEDSDLVFSPYQMIPETNVEWLMDGKIRLHPEALNERASVINGQITARDLRLKAVYLEYVQNISLTTDSDRDLLQNINNCVDKDINSFALQLCNEHKNDSKESFYPLIHSLLRIIGLDCRGEVSRYDAYSIFDNHIIPVEIKSFTETPVYNAKGIRQAIENKITTYNQNLIDDLEYSSLLVGFSHPTNDSDVKNLIDEAFDKFKIKIIAADLNALIKMALNAVWNQKYVDLDKVLKSYGLLIE